MVRVGSLARWALIVVVLGVVVGCASAGFLWSLALVTEIQATHPWLLFALPVAGAVIALAYQRYGREAEGGNNLILEQIHEPGTGVPLRMFPLVLAGTLATHLCGGSAGREGTAVQMGGSIAGFLGKHLRLPAQATRLLLMAGISAGFASVFGTPLAGTVFAMEVLALGSLRYEALLLCLAAALVGDWTVYAWGIHHTPYPTFAHLSLTPLLLGKLVLISIAFGAVSALFAEWTHLLAATAKRLIPRPVIRTAVGGICVVVATLLLRTRAYNGLSLPLLQQAFSAGGVPTWAFLWKLGLTGLTLGVGFKGGEVTPLFVVGATLGATLGRLLGIPADVCAALGFIAVFAAAANTPLACLLMGIELFGAGLAVPLAISTFIAYVCSGHRGIYLSQRIAVPKFTIMGVDSASIRLRDLRQKRSER